MNRIPPMRLSELAKYMFKFQAEAEAKGLTGKEVDEYVNEQLTLIKVPDIVSPQSQADLSHA